MRRVAAVTLLLAAGVSNPAPLLAQEVDFSGQVRPRFEFRDPVGGGLDDFTSMRVRFAADVAVDEGLQIFIQAQDVRIWGEETHPLFDASADRFDLHQGYLRYRGEEWGWLTTTVGRMETNLGGQRLLGAVDWTQQGQSFDGVRLDIEAGRTRWSLLGFAVGDETAPAVDADEELYGVYGTVDDLGPGALDLYWLYDRVSAAASTDEHWLGARYVFDVDLGGRDIFGRLEATAARGTRADADLAAWMLGARVGTTVLEGRLGAAIWYDRLSGDDPATADVESFRTLYATNHKFYGFADLFLDVPAHTGGAGLQDLALKLSWRVGDSMTAGLDAHTFRAAESAGLAESRFGEELDFTFTHRYGPHLAATFGLSHVFQAAGLDEVGRLSEDMTWLYVMLDASF